MIDLSRFVSNPYIGFQKIFCFDYQLSNDDFIGFVRLLEKETGLKLMADKEGDILNGFVTMCPQFGLQCTWGDHFKEGDHTSVILSLYDKDKEPNEESSTIFRKVNITEELKRYIESAYSLFYE